MDSRKKNRIYEPFLLLFITAIVFVALSFFKTSFSIGNFNAQQISFLSDLKEDVFEADDTVSNSSNNHPVRKQTIQGEIQEHHQIEFSNDSSGGLFHFFQALDFLKAGKKKTVRIAYFGDSMIENDFITSELRKKFQEAFGGMGVGFMSVTSVSAEYRKTIIKTFSGNWKSCELDEIQNHPTGISGYTFVPAWKDAPDRKNNSSVSGASWVKFLGADLPGLNSFHNVRLFYGPANGMQSIGVNEQRILLPGKNRVNELKLNSNIPLESYYIKFDCSQPLDVYGFSFDSDEGIFIDNFSLRGKNGMSLAMIPDSVLTGMNKYLDYDLVIFQFGINVLDTKLANFKWYESGMQAVVAHFRESFPGTSILVISASDRGFNQSGKWTTNPEIPLLVESQKHFSEMSGCGFWNLYQKMGGFESMATKWVGADTALANKDYTHFNEKGAQRIGEMLYKDLIWEYDLYKNNSQIKGK